MTAREKFAVDQLIEHANDLLLKLGLAKTENDTLREENDNYKQELVRVYRQLSNTNSNEIGIGLREVKYSET